MSILSPNLIRESLPWHIANVLRRVGGKALDASDAGTLQLPTSLHVLFTLGLTLTNQAEAEQFLGNVNTGLARADLTGYSQVRIAARVTTGTASENSPRVYVGYKTGALSTTVGDYVEIPGAEASLTTAGQIVSEWVDLPAAAKADVNLAVLMSGGDGSIDPAVGRVEVQFR